MSKGTRNGHYVSYARICVYIEVYGALPDAIKMIFMDEVWLQNIDYEHIPFRCKKCHEHGQLFRDCPLNKAPQISDHVSKKKTMKNTSESTPGIRTTGKRLSPKSISIMRQFKTLLMP